MKALQSVVAFATAALFAMQGAAVCGQELSADVLAQDMRLEKRISLSGRRMYLAEVLDEISRRSGIAISVDERESSSGAQVGIECRDVPVRDVIDCLWSLLSSKDMEWTWERSGVAPSYSYTLRELDRAKYRSERMASLSQKAFEKLVKVMGALSLMTAEDRELHKRLLSQALLQDDDVIASKFVKEQDRWDLVRLFTQSVPDGALSAALRGQSRTSIPVDSLSQDLQTLFHAVWMSQRPNISKNGVPVEVLEPNTLQFYTVARSGHTADVVPTLMMYWGENGGSYSVCGGYALDIGARKAIWKRWMLAGDTLTDPSADKTAGPRPPEKNTPEPEPGAAREPNDGLFAVSMSQLSQGSSVPNIALLPDERGRNIGSPYDKKIGAFLDGFERRDPFPIYKWRDHVLLVSYPRWFVDDDNTIPFYLVRKYLRRPDTLIPLNDLVKLVVGLDGYDTSEIAETYPAVAAAMRYRPAIMLFRNEPGIISPQGIQLRADELSILRSMPQFANRIYDTDTGFRMLQEDREASGSHMLLIHFEVQRDGKWKRLEAFSQIARAASKEGGATSP